MASLSVVIPMYNEEAMIAHGLDCVRAALERHVPDWEMIIVDDASVDGCAGIVASIASRDARVRLLRHEKNRTLGGTVRIGFAAATKDLVLYMDADLPFDPDVIGRAIHVLEVTGADLIAPYRFDRTTEGLRRSLYSFVYNTLIRVLFGWPHRDINFPLKLIRREVLDAVELRSEGSLIDAELVVKTRNLGFVVHQIGIDYFPRTKGQSTLSSPRVILKILREISSLFFEMRNPVRRQAGTGTGT